MGGYQLVPTHFFVCRRRFSTGAAPIARMRSRAGAHRGSQGRSRTRSEHWLASRSSGPHPGSTGTYIDVPLIYYKGYTASLTTVDQKETKLQVTGEGQNGYCRVLLTGDEPAGLLTVYYKGTIVQNISYIISVLTLIGLFGYGFWVRKKGNSRQEEGS